MVNILRNNNGQFKGLAGKRLIGEDSHFSKLTEKKVLKIRKLYFSGEYNYNELSKMFNVTFSTIWEIVKKHSWKHL